MGSSVAVTDGNFFVAMDELTTVVSICWKSVWVQHEIDLELYRSAHQHPINRYLHWISIPLEVASFFLVVKLVLALLVQSDQEDTRRANTSSSGHDNHGWLASPVHVLSPLWRTTLDSLLEGVGYTLGLLSFGLSIVGCRNNGGAVSMFPVASTEWRIGLLTLVFHILMVKGCNRMVRFASRELRVQTMANKKNPTTLQRGKYHQQQDRHLSGLVSSDHNERRYSYVLMGTVLLWTLSWVLQVGLGHYLIEGNQPNLASPSDVSTLSVVTSVLLAWKS